MGLTKSKIFLYLCLSFILGVAVASFINIPQLISGIFLIGAIIVVIISWQTPHQDKLGAGQKKWILVVLGFCIIFVIAGIWRFQSQSKISENDISKFNEKGRIVFSGIVDEEPDIRMENQKLIIDVTEVQLLLEVGLLDIAGRVLVTASKYPEYQYGDKLEITGFLKPPENFEDFDYSAYLAKDNIYSLMYYPEVKKLSENNGSRIKSVLLKIKNSFEDNLAKVLPEPQNSLANGLILGEKAALPQNLLDIFAIVGITHIIALSGYNITIIGENLRKVFNSLMISRNYSFWISVALIVAFVIMTGASASIVRAAVMGILLILARKTNRLYSIRNALVFAGVVMIYLNPKILRFDTGFQLSFLATLGLVYISPFFEKYFLWLPKTLDLRGIASATFGAQIAVLPLVLFNFGRLSLVSPLANILILPIIPFAMFFGFSSGLVSWLWLGFGKFIGWVAWLILTYQIKAAELISKIPLASMDVKIGWVWLVIMYMVLWGSVIFLIQKAKAKRHIITK